MACIIKANTIVIYDVGVVNYATNSGVTIYDASVVFFQPKILGNDASVVFTTLKDFHNSEQYDAGIVFLLYRPLVQLSQGMDHGNPRIGLIRGQQKPGECTLFQHSYRNR